MATKPTHDRYLDARGLVCPEPLLLTRHAVRKLDSGQVLFVQATDPSTVRDLRNFCRFLGHTMIAEAQSDNADENDFEFWIQKA